MADSRKLLEIRTNIGFFSLFLRKALGGHQEETSNFVFVLGKFCRALRVGFRQPVRNHRMDGQISNLTYLRKDFTDEWLEVFRRSFLQTSQELPKIIIILSLICMIGGRCNSFYFSVFCGCILYMSPYRIKEGNNSKKLVFSSLNSYLYPKIFNQMNPIIICP